MNPHIEDLQLTSFVALPVNRVPPMHGNCYLNELLSLVVNVIVLESGRTSFVAAFLFDGRA